MELCVVSMELWARHMGRHCVVDKIVTFWGAEFPFFSGTEADKEQQNLSAMFSVCLREDWELRSQITYYPVDHAMTAHMTSP